MRRILTLLLALAMCLSLLSGCAGGIAEGQNPQETENTQTSDTVTALNAELPEVEDHWDAVFASGDLQSGMDSFYANTIPAFLRSDAEENLVYSPLNVYLALAMLAETADGETRAQILTLLDVPDMETLRGQVALLWAANYRDDDEGVSLLANSVWMNDGVTYEEETLKTLAERHYASSFVGTMGTKAMDEALQNWINDNTGGLLKDYVANIHTDPLTVLEIVSTIYYKAAWGDSFYEGFTTEETFHGAKGDTSCDMMHQTDDRMFCRGDNFTAVGLGLSDGGVMYFLLPNEGVSVNDVLNDPQMLDYVRGSGETVTTDYLTVHMSIPKFDLSSRLDLSETLEALGITDAFAAGQADFSNLTHQVEEIYVSKVEHTAKVTIDEDGVTGAAYTAISMEATAANPEEMEEVDFVLDRPFCYAVVGADGSVLFAGTVWEMEF